MKSSTPNALCILAFGLSQSCSTSRPLPAETPPPLRASGTARPAQAATQRLGMGGFGICALASPERLSCWPWPRGRGSLPRHWHVAGATQLGVGRAHACVLASGRVACVGSNRQGQLGLPALAGTEELREVSGLPPVRQLAVGFDHACALDNMSAVWCWGHDAAPHLEPVDRAHRPRRIPELAANAVLAHGHLTCAVTTRGALDCWGLPEVPKHLEVPAGAIGYFMHMSVFCTLGTGAPECVELLGREPFEGWGSRRLANPESFAQLAVGAQHACGLSRTGRVSCWGDNSWAQLGQDPKALCRTSSDAPQAVALTRPLQLAAYGDATCALEAEGNLACWGGVAPAFRTYHSEPQRVAELDDVQALSAGGDRTCARSSDGWQCWGRALIDGSLSGTVAAGESAPPAPHRYAPRSEPALRGLPLLVLSGSAACGLLRGRALCATHGEGSQAPATCAARDQVYQAPGRLPTHWPLVEGLLASPRTLCSHDGGGTLRCVPAPGSTAAAPASARTLGIVGREPALSDRLVCAISEHGEVHCQPPLTQADTASGRRQVPTLEHAGQLALSDQQLCGLVSPREVRCTQLDQGSLGTSLVTSPTPLTQIVMAGEQLCGLDDRAEVRCVRAGDTRLGDPLLGGVKHLVAGSCHFCSLGNAGQVHCWGCNHAGQVGTGVLPYSATPSRLSHVATRSP